MCIKIFFDYIYESDEVVILVWFLTVDICHYHWLQGPMNQLLSNYKAKHLIWTIQHMFEFCQCKFFCNII
jgi:hypothetical protein